HPVSITNRTSRRREPEGAVVRLAIVITGESESGRRPQDQNCWGQGPIKQGKSRVGAVGTQTGGVKGREVGINEVVRVHQRRPGGVDDEGRQHRHRQRRLYPPGILAQGRDLLVKPPCPRCWYRSHLFTHVDYPSSLRALFLGVLLTTLFVQIIAV